MICTGVVVWCDSEGDGGGADAAGRVLHVVPRLLHLLKRRRALKGHETMPGADRPWMHSGDGGWVFAEHRRGVELHADAEQAYTAGNEVSDDWLM